VAKVYRIKRMMGEDEQRLAVCSADDELQRPVWHIDAAHSVAIGGVNEDLAIGQLDPAR